MKLYFRANSRSRCWNGFLTVAPLAAFESFVNGDEVCVKVHNIQDFKQYLLAEQVSPNQMEWIVKQPKIEGVFAVAPEGNWIQFNVSIVRNLIESAKAYEMQAEAKRKELADIAKKPIQLNEAEETQSPTLSDSDVAPDALPDAAAKESAPQSDALVVSTKSPQCFNTTDANDFCLRCMLRAKNAPQPLFDLNGGDLPGFASAGGDAALLRMAKQHFSSIDNARLKFLSRLHSAELRITQPFVLPYGNAHLQFQLLEFLDSEAPLAPLDDAETGASVAAALKSTVLPVAVLDLESLRALPAVADAPSGEKLDLLKVFDESKDYYFLLTGSSSAVIADLRNVVVWFLPRTVIRELKRMKASEGNLQRFNKLLGDLVAHIMDHAFMRSASDPLGGTAPPAVIDTRLVSADSVSASRVGQNAVAPLLAQPEGTIAARGPRTVDLLPPAHRFSASELDSAVCTPAVAHQVFSRHLRESELLRRELEAVEKRNDAIYNALCREITFRAKVADRYETLLQNNPSVLKAIVDALLYTKSDTHVRNYEESLAGTFMEQKLNRNIDLRNFL